MFAGWWKNIDTSHTENTPSLRKSQKKINKLINTNKNVGINS